MLVSLSMNKTKPANAGFVLLAEGERFELSKACALLPFQDSALDHYANPPIGRQLNTFIHHQADYGKNYCEVHKVISNYEKLRNAENDTEKNRTDSERL